VPDLCARTYSALKVLDRVFVRHRLGSMATRAAATRLQSLWRGRSARRQRSANDTRELLPVSRLAPADSADSSGALEDADGATTLINASSYTSAHDLTRLAEHPELLSIDTGTGTSSRAREDLVSPGGVARRRLQLRALGMVAMSGVLFALQGACVKLARDEPGGGTFEMVTARGMVQLVGVLGSNAWLHARGEHPLPVRHWLGVSWAQRKWLVARALVGFAGIGFGFSAIQRIPLGDASALSFVSPSVSVAVAWLTLGEAVGRAELLLALHPNPDPNPSPAPRPRSHPHPHPNPNQACRATRHRWRHLRRGARRPAADAVLAARRRRRGGEH
jgi:drug/metabolite transporter (DMT)-like permease